MTTTTSLNAIVASNDTHTVKNSNYNNNDGNNVTSSSSIFPVGEAAMNDGRFDDDAISAYYLWRHSHDDHENEELVRNTEEANTNNN